MKPIEQAIIDYDAVPVPVGLTHDLGEYHYDGIQNEFYRQLIEALGFVPEQSTDYFAIRHRMLVPIVQSGTRDHNDSFSGRMSDDFLSELVLEEAQTLAIMLRTRTSFNYETVHFAKVPLHDNTLRYLAHLAIDL